MSVTTEADPVPAHQAEAAGSAQTDASAASAAPAAAAPTVPLRRNVNFQLLWAGSSAAFIGIAVADIAYPLVILAMTHSPFKAGLFATVQLIAMLVTTLPAGQLLDKVDRRLALLGTELVRAVVVAGVAVAWYLDALTFWQLMGTAAVLGAVQPFGAARMLMVRTVVPSEQLTSAFTQEQVRDHGSQLVGPPLGGALYAVSRSLPFVVAAATFLVSFACAFFVKLPPKAAAQPAAPADGESVKDTEGAATTPPADEIGGGMFAGLGVVLRNPLMRATTLTLTIVNAVGFPLYLALIVLLQQEHQSSSSIGVVFGTMSAGGLLGTLLVKPSHRMLRPGWLLIAACGVFTVCVGVLPLVSDPYSTAALLFVANLVIPAAVVMIDILIVRQVPDEQRGRVGAAIQTLMALGMPAGMLIGGAALQYFSPTTVLAVMAAWMAVSLVYAVCQRALRDAQWPTDAQPALVAEAVPSA